MLLGLIRTGAYDLAGARAESVEVLQLLAIEQLGTKREEASEDG
ncbi:MAG TPA: hypothetical protein VIZ17_09135 [Acetobacteraceae bacterium]